LHTALQADDDQPPRCGQHFEIGFQIFGTDDVQNDVGLDTVFGHVLGEIRVVVIDADIGAQLVADIQLALRAGRHDHSSAEGFSHLNCHRADAAAAAVHQQGLPGLQFADHEDVRPYG